MKNSVITERYAEGFFSLAREVLGLPQTLQELQTLKSILRTNPEFKIFLESPVISCTEKTQWIEQVLQPFFSSQLRHFISFLVGKRRSEFLDDIIDYLRMKYEYQEERAALLQVSSPLDLEMLKAIKEQLEKKVQHRLKLYVHLDGELLGGIRARIGNTLIDGSIEGSLVELREKLLQLKVN